MKYIHFYRNQGLSESEVFSHFLGTIKPSIKVWDYFINWEKVNSNVESIKIELNLLNSLIGSQNIEEDFISLLIKYPETVKAIPFLLAVRENNLGILKDYKSGDLSYLEFKFTCKKQVNEAEARDYLLFIKKSGLINLFYDRKIKNFVDYVFGVEVGLDSNGRKNRGGKLMEDVVEVFVKDATSKNESLQFISQATASKVKQEWNFNVNFDVSERSHDFAVYNKATNKLFLLETNFYNAGGSKLKSVCGEFKSLFNELQVQNIELIWITDGDGWLTTKRPLEETFKNNNYVLNLNLLQNGILDEIFKE